MPRTPASVTGAVIEGDVVRIKFDDDHEAIFEGFQSESIKGLLRLRRFLLKKTDRLVVQYDGQLTKTGVQPHEHCFVVAVNGYSIERIVAYWTAAKEYTERDASVLSKARKIVSSGWFELDEIQEGHKMLPEKSATSS